VQLKRKEKMFLFGQLVLVPLNVIIIISRKIKLTEVTGYERVFHRLVIG
jgi:hypothetical protein